MSGRLLFLAVSAGVLLSPTLAAVGPFVGAMRGLGDVRHHILSSEIVERGFHLFVRLPESYSEEEAAKFPTV